MVEDVILPDGSLRRTAIFNVSAVSSYAVKIVGATTSAAALFHVGELISVLRAMETPKGLREVFRTNG